MVRKSLMQFSWVWISVFLFLALGCENGDSDVDKIAENLADQLTDCLQFENGEHKSGSHPSGVEAEDVPQISTLVAPESIRLGASFSVLMHSAFPDKQKVKKAVVYVRGATKYIEVVTNLENEFADIVGTLTDNTDLLRGKPFELEFALQLEDGRTGVYRTSSLLIEDKPPQRTEDPLAALSLETASLHETGRPEGSPEADAPQIVKVLAPEALAPGGRFQVALLTNFPSPESIDFAVLSIPRSEAYKEVTGKLVKDEEGTRYIVTGTLAEDAVEDGDRLTFLWALHENGGKVGIYRSWDLLVDEDAEDDVVPILDGDDPLVDGDEEEEIEAEAEDELPEEGDLEEDVVTIADGDLEDDSDGDEMEEEDEGEQEEEPALQGWLLRDRTIVPSGGFFMGTNPNDMGYSVEETQHFVTLTRSLEVTRTEITQDLFMSLVGGLNPSVSSDCGPDCPVESVTWNQAQYVARIASLAAGLEPCHQCTGTPQSPSCIRSTSYPNLVDCPGYRLPTEAEWEYITRAGSETALSLGDVGTLGCNWDSFSDMAAWYCVNSSVESMPSCEDLSADGGSQCAGIHPVAQKQSNTWGLFDVHGNVAEWTDDWHMLFSEDEQTDPLGPPNGTKKVVRGGSYRDSIQELRSAARGAPYNLGENAANRAVGFRLVRSVSDEGTSCPSTPVTCGTTLPDQNLGNGSRAFNATSCSDADLDGQDMIYTFTAEEPLPTTVILTTSVPTLRVSVLFGCNPNACVAQAETAESGASVTFHPVPNQPYTIVVDSEPGFTGGFELAVACDGVSPER